MRSGTRLIIACVCLLATSVVAQAQVVPDALQNVVQRQAEQARERAAERAQEQAAERAREQARERVQQQANDRVQAQATEQVAERTADRTQEQAADRAQRQAAERTQEQATERVLEQSVDRVQGQARAAQNQALDRVQGGQAERAQEQLLERTSQQLERAQEQLERNQEQLERAQENLDRVAGQAAGAARGSGNGMANDRELPEAAQNGLQIAQQASAQALGRIPGPSPMAALPERLPIVDANGSEVFVEIAIEPNIRALERDWVMLLSETQREQLVDEAPDLMLYLAQTSTLTALNSYVLRFSVPPDLDADEQILQLVPEGLRELIDRNHVYSAQSAQPVELPVNPETGEGAADVEAGVPLSVPMRAVCEDPVSVGVIDSMINTGHPAFARPVNAGPVFVSRQFLQDQVDKTSGHGTAVAGVLVGRGQDHGSDLAPLLPNATIYSASVVYSQDPYHQGATVMHLLEAMSWMLEQDQLRVINMSLTGPANRLLEQAIQTVQAQGRVVVAAAGNEGPHADLLYPAAYDGVITATAVAHDHTVYRWAAQGDHVDFSALGVSVPTARGDGGFGRESGTSMAAPIVSAFFACELASGAFTADRARARLTERAADLGAAGHDPVFGHGLLHP